jgi:hypothetical protein
MAEDMAVEDMVETEEDMVDLMEAMEITATLIMEEDVDVETKNDDNFPALLFVTKRLPCHTCSLFFCKYIIFSP